MVIERVPLASPDAQALIASLNAELAGAYPEPGANHFGLTEDEVAPGRGVFVVLRDAGGTPVGCGALRKLDDERAELKRMFVREERRGQGLARRLLEALEAEAVALGVARVVLETGTRQHAAIQLYRRSGYVPIEAYGEYIGSPLSLCFEKRLAR